MLTRPSIDRPQEPYLFVCYAHADAAAVYEELNWFKEQHINFWYDDGIEAGTEWREELARAIENASLMIFFVTARSVQSENCRKEVNYALDQGVSIIPIHLEKSELPGGLNMALSNIQAILKYQISEESYRKKLGSRIAAYMDSPSNPSNEITEKVAPSTERRQLAAIMFTDICGYAELMADNEQHALEIVAKNRGIQQAIVAKHHGTWLKEMGDGTLSSFPSTVSAVQCAIEIQTQLRGDSDYRLRIGIHLGDVVFTGSDVFGDGVNIAARIEPTAAAGGIAISGQVYDTLTSRKEMGVLYLGEKTLKNVKQPVKIFAVTNASLPTPAVFADAPVADPADAKSIVTVMLKTPVRYLIAASLLVITGIGVFQLFNDPEGPGLQVSSQAPALLEESPAIQQSPATGADELIDVSALNTVTSPVVEEIIAETDVAYSVQTADEELPPAVAQEPVQIATLETPTTTVTEPEEETILVVEPSPSATLEDPVEELILASLSSIAVLPLANLSADPNNAYFAAGIHEEILNQLAKISDIRVLSRRSVLKYADTTESIGDIARELGVATIMEGSVRFAGNRVRITCQLIRASDESHIWSETYERELEDIFEIQSDVALQAANAMQASLLPSERESIERIPTTNTEAYNLYLRAVYRAEQNNYSFASGTGDWLQELIDNLKHVIQLDPLFAAAHANLAMAYAFTLPAGFFSGRNPEAEGLASQHALRAIELEPASSEAYGVLAILAVFDRDWKAFDDYAEQALESSMLGLGSLVNLAVGYSVQQRYDKVTEMLDRALAIDANDQTTLRFAIMMYNTGRNYTAALEYVERFRAVGGEDEAYHLHRAYALHFLGREPESDAELNLIKADFTTGDLAFYPFYGYLECRRGNEARIQALGPTVGILSAGMMAIGCDLGKGEFDRVFATLDGLMAGNVLIPDLGGMSDEISQDPRWAAIVEYRGLP